MKLELSNIQKEYEALKVLSDINFHLNKGEIISILGTSGCGKSTLLNIIAGFIKPTSGTVLKDGQDITGKISETAYMLQDDLLLPYKTIFENVILPITIKGLLTNEKKEEVLNLFKIFGLEGYENFYPRELSGGMKQRAALLRTYLCGTDIYLFDEPFSKLDSITRDSMRVWFLEIWKTIHSSAIFITHDIDEAIILSDRIYIMSDKPATIVKEILVSQDCKDIGEESFGKLKVEILSYFRKI
ncbi:MAG: ABC transporter ATP-binding protein [Fusobacteriaceae bacterium]